MLSEDVAGERGSDLLLTIERHVDREMHAHHPRDLAHIVVDRVPLGHAPRGERVADVLCVVERHHRFEPGQSGRHHLGSAAETGEEVRLDEAGRDPHVGIEELAIQKHLHTGGGRAHASQRRGVAAVVIDHRVAAQDLAAEHALELLIGVATMGARRDENRDVFRLDLRQLLEDGLQLLDSRLRARDVADGDRDLLTGADECLAAARVRMASGSP